MHSSRESQALLARESKGHTRRAEARAQARAARRAARAAAERQASQVRGTRRAAGVR
jgi:hypothetical protein